MFFFSLVTVFVLKPVLCDIINATQGFFSFPFAWKFFFLSLHFQWMCLQSSSESIDGSWFFNSSILCVMTGEFSPFIFQVIVDSMYLLPFCLLFPCCFCASSPFLFLLLVFSLVIWWLTLVFCLDYFVYFLCICYRILVCGYPGTHV